MAFTKGVHRIIIDTKKELTADTVTALYAKDNGDWETAIFTDGTLKTNTITYLLANVLQNKVFNCNASLCDSVEVTDSGIARAALTLPNSDETSGIFAIDFGAINTSKNIYDQEITADVLVLPGYVSGSTFTRSNSSYHSGLIVISNNHHFTSASELSVLQYPLIVTVDVQDDFYSIGINSYMTASTVANARNSFIQTNIFIGKTDKDNDYMLYNPGYSSSPTSRNIYDPQFQVAISDGSSLIIDTPLYVEQPYDEIGGFGKLNKLVVYNNDLGWYYGSPKYTSLVGMYNKTPSDTASRNVYVNTYNFNRFVDNALTINNKSFDAYVGRTSYGVGLYREHE